MLAIDAGALLALVLASLSRPERTYPLTVVLAALLTNLAVSVVRGWLARRRYATRGYQPLTDDQLRRSYRGWTSNYRGWKAARPRTSSNRRMASHCHREVRAVKRAARKRGVHL